MERYTSSDCGRLRMEGCGPEDTQKLLQKAWPKGCYHGFKFRESVQRSEEMASTRLLGTGCEMRVRRQGWPLCFWLEESVMDASTAIGNTGSETDWTPGEARLC